MVEVDLSKISILGFTLPFSFTQNGTFTWVNKWTSTETQTLGSTASINIYPPVYLDFYPQGQPTQFDVYRDNVYGSYMFYSGVAPPQSPGQILINPSPVQFGSVKGGTTSPPLQVTLTNNSSLAILYTKPAINFSDPSFSTVPNSQSTPDTCSYATVAANATCTIFIQYTPSASQTPVTGSTAVNAMMYASGNTDAVVTATAQIGAAVLPLFAAPGPINFGSIPVQSQSATVVVTFTNQSNRTISLPGNEYSFSDPGFSLGSGTDTCRGQNISPGASCSIPVQFWPYPPEITSTGTIPISGTLTLLSTSGPVSSVSLQGTAMVSVLGTPGAATYTITGTEQDTITCNQQGACYPTAQDTGNAVIVVIEMDRNHNTTTQTYVVQYGYAYTPEIIAGQLIAAINADPKAAVLASFGGTGVVSLVSKYEGVVTNYYLSGGVSGSYQTPSFQATHPSMMSGGTDPRY